MKYGPISAATSAMMKAIANPSSVVCTGSPLWASKLRCPGLKGPPAAHPPPRYIRIKYRGNCGEVTASSRDASPEGTLPARRQPLQAAQHEGRPPFRIFRVIEPQVREPAQQGGNRDLRLDTRELGAEAEVDTAAKGQRLHIGPRDVEAVRMIGIDRSIPVGRTEQ